MPDDAKRAAECMHAACTYDTRREAGARWAAANKQTNAHDRPSEVRLYYPLSEGMTDVQKRGRAAIQPGHWQTCYYFACNGGEIACSRRQLLL